MEDSSEAPRSGRVAIVGRPNVGKSTLLNSLLGQKLAITTPRPGTTRSNLLGVHLSAEPPTQIAFVDTPGLERPRSVLGRVLVEEAQGSLENADAVLLVVDATSHGKGNDAIATADEDVLAQIESVGRPTVLALNKVDRVKPKHALLPRLAAWSERHPGLAALVPISALNEVNLGPLVAELRKLLPEGTMYPEDFLTDRPVRFFVAELVREALIGETRQELPYSVAVQVETFEEDTDLTRIGATIFVDRPSHKGMVIGKQGARIKAIGTTARAQIETLVGRKVFLELFVRVEESWTRDPVQVRRLTRESDQ